jgi:hypothetical protein
LEGGLLDGTVTGRCDLRVHARTLEKLLDRAGDAVAVEWVGVLIAGDDELVRWMQAAALTVVVVDVTAPRGTDVVGPEPDLIVVASPVAVFGTVEHGWCGVTHEEVHCLATDLDRHVPMALRRQPEHSELIRRVPVGRRGRRGVVG